MSSSVSRTEVQRDQGFTLIELLVVIIIIGILAAIAIPTFLSQREKGWESQARSDLRNAAVAAESYAVEHNGAYAGFGPAQLASQGFNATDAVDVTVASANSARITIEAEHDQFTGVVWTYDSDTGLITRS